MDMPQQRALNMARLLDRSRNATLIYSNDPGERFAAVAFITFGDHVDETQVSTHATFEEAASHLGGNVLDGLAADAIYDLDTGERIEVHVSTPIVTRAEDQGMLINVLDDEQ